MAINDVKEALNNPANFNAFAARAKKSTSGTEVMQNLKKFQGRDIAVSFPEGVYLVDFDVINIRDRKNDGVMKPVAVYNFTDTPDGAPIGYTLGGSVINRMVEDWIQDIGGGDLNRTRALYKSSGQRIRVKISYGTTSGGNPCQNVEVC